MKGHKLLFLLLILFLGFSCNTRETYFQFEELKDTGWSKNDTLYFDIDSSLIEVGQKYDVFIEIINNTDYRYQNIWFYISDNFDNNYFKKYENQYLLADSTGKWYGDGFGQLYQLSLPYKKDLSFSNRKNYQLKIVHGMIDEPLIGIDKVGIRIRSAEDY